MINGSTLVMYKSYIHKYQYTNFLFDNKYKFSREINDIYNNLYKIKNNNIEIYKKLKVIPVITLYKLYKKYYNTTKKYWLVLPKNIYINEPRWKSHCKLIKKTNINFHKLPIDIIDYICVFIPSKLQDIIHDIKCLVYHIQELYVIFNHLNINNTYHRPTVIIIYPILLAIYTKIYKLYDKINDPYYQKIALKIIDESYTFDWFNLSYL